MARDRNLARVGDHELDVSYVGNARLKQIMESYRDQRTFSFSLGRLFFGIGDKLSNMGYQDSYMDEYFDSNSEGYSEYPDGTSHR